METRNVSYGLPTSSNLWQHFADNFVWTAGSPASQIIFPSLSLFPSLLLSTQSPSLNTDGGAAPARLYTFLCLYVLRVALCSDSRHSTRGYYIVKPFNYLGKLLPGIFAPACLNECTWLQAGVGVVYPSLFRLAVCAPSLSLSQFPTLRSTRPAAS